MKRVRTCLLFVCLALAAGCSPARRGGPGVAPETAGFLRAPRQRLVLDPRKHLPAARGERLGRRVHPQRGNRPPARVVPPPPPEGGRGRGEGTPGRARRGAAVTARAA